MTAFIKTVEQTEKICVENIGPKERRRRVLFGLQGVAIGLVSAAVMLALGVEWYWRLSLFLIFAPAMFGFFQAFERT